MTETDAFIRAIAENVYDDVPRRVYADWLEEHGEADRAAFIRTQCELEPIRDQYEIDRAVELHALEDRLLGKHRKTWLGKMPKAWDDWRSGASCEFRCGFVDTVSMPVRTFSITTWKPCRASTAGCGRKPTTVDTPKRKEMRDKMYAQKYEEVSKNYLNEVRKGSMIEYRQAAGTEDSNAEDGSSKKPKGRRN